MGVGGRCQQHIDVILQMQKENKNVVPIAVCDVWDGDPKLGNGKGRGLYPSAERCGINVNDKTRVSKDYRKILELKEVDIACIATPDHWHARMSIDAMNAGKDVYCEKPMTRTIAEAQEVVDAAGANKPSAAANLVATTVSKTEIMLNWNNLINFPYNVLDLLKEFVGGVSSQ